MQLSVTLLPMHEERVHFAIRVPQSAPPLLEFWCELRSDLMYDKHWNQDVETWYSYMFLGLLSTDILVANNYPGINLSCRCLRDQYRCH